MEENNMPEQYKDGVNRVSDIVSFMFPFAGHAEARFNDWLYSKGIVKEEYMTEACDVGTFVHLQIENHILGKEQDIQNVFYELHRDEIMHGINIFNSIKKQEPHLRYEIEHYVLDSDGRYQGTIDLVQICDNTKRVWLYDWKTWGIAKKKYGLPNTYRKPSDKLKKVRLQLSLYAYFFKRLGYKIEGINGVWLHEDNGYVYGLDIMEDSEIEEILLKFYTKDKFNLELTIENMKLIIQSPTGLQYELARVEAEVTEGQKAVDVIDKMIEAKEQMVKKLATQRSS